MRQRKTLSRAPSAAHERRFRTWRLGRERVLFAGYHLHVPWVIPVTLIDTFSLALASKYFRSALIGIVVHSAQSVFITILILTLVV